jgi:immune inhibitor A
MAQSRLSGRGEAIGTRAGDLSAWDKLQLGWLDYEIVPAGTERRLVLGPHEYNSRKPQGVVVPLPDKEVTAEYGDPFAGERMYWSGSGDDLSNTMTRELDLSGGSSASLSLQARYEIEADYDYLYAQVSTDGGESWTSLDGQVDGEPFVDDGGGNPAISGSSGGEWVRVDIPLDSVAGGPVLFRFLYRTDGAVAPMGFLADELVLTVDGDVVLSDGAEDGGQGWQLDGFRTTTGTETNSFDNYYIASNRTYESFDRYLRTGPYNFGFPDRPDFVEHFSYERGLLVSYWDTSQRDNNTSEHPGEGLILPIDAHPRPIYRIDGAPWRSRVQVYDAPFSTQAPASFTLHVEGKPSYIRGRGRTATFDDRRTYWYPEIPLTGVKVPAAGVRMTVRSMTETSLVVDITSKR